MNRRIICVFLCALVASVVLTNANAFAQEATFYQQVDLSPLDSVAVQTEGRLKSFGSFAHSQMGYVSGSRKINGQRPEFTFLDMLFRPKAYEDADVIYVKAPIVRKSIADAIVLADPNLSARMDGFIKTGLISEELLQRSEVEPVMRQMQLDLLRTAKAMDSLRGARTVMRPDFLLRELRIIPTAGDQNDQQWSSIRDIMLLAADPGALKASGTTATPIAGIDEAKQRACAAAWKSLVEGWTNGDAEKVNQSVVEIAAILPSINPGAYPDSNRLRWESWYFSNGNLSWIWLVYAFSVTLLLLGLVYHWRGARIAGIAMFLVAFGLQSCALGLRWWISSRWPNSNMFEAVTTSAWFGGCAAVILEIFMRRRAAAGMFALASGFASAVALMAAHFLPVQLNAQISNMMPVLHDVWLYIHTNVIIFSYCLIFMAAVSAGMYLIYRVFGGKAVYARVGASSVGAIVGGGAGTPGGNALRGEKLGEVLDGVTMLLMKLSFVLLWAGIAMGAIWADHSWGRPWGWDPKEVFALNTFVVFAILVHVRYRSKDKGLWTALLAVVGAAVMLFNWIVINFIITGLHSYA
ncbi:MAG: cytochrome c biogenesis protein CcsA [Planctomycetota bacterium]|nr:cytochrome c biogenesis protein CcsA [Planctomycetota bacterium]MDA1263134.1 cytochrome c biogenesis protein CcsA [Planctomycetota bacterium]